MMPERGADFQHQVVRALGSIGAATLARYLERCWDVERRFKSGGEVRAELDALVAELAGVDMGGRAGRRAG